MKEIINTATDIKTPSLWVYLEPHITKEDVKAKVVQTKLAYTSPQTVTAAIEIWYDPDPSITVIEEDCKFDTFFAIPHEDTGGKIHLQFP
jgi:DNA-directed RNA polymerase II subunit RPB1